MIRERKEGGEEGKDVQGKERRDMSEIPVYACFQLPNSKQRNGITKLGNLAKLPVHQQKKMIKENGHWNSRELCTRKEIRRGEKEMK